MCSNHYIEKDGVSIETIIEFSFRIIQNNTIKVSDGELTYHTFSHKNQIPNILFDNSNNTESTESTESKQEDLTFIPPLPICRLREGNNIKGKWAEPVFNLESRLESYYSSGLAQCNMYYLYEFAKLIVFAIEKNMVIMTEKTDSTRKFHILNSGCEDPNYYFS